MFKIVAIIFLLNCQLQNKLDEYDSLIDDSAQNLKSQILKNYLVKEKKTIAIASLARTDLISASSRYYSVIPKLGIIYANSLQNEMFHPEKFDLLERQRIDGLLKEIYYDRIGFNEEIDKSLKLIGADYILLGTLQKRESSIRIDARLVDTTSGKIVSVGTTTLYLNEYISSLYNDYPNTMQNIETVIYADKGWQPINAIINGSAEIDINAKGQWSITDKYKIKTDAIGINDNPYNLYLNENEIINKNVVSTETWQHVYSSMEEISEIEIEADGQWSMTNPNIVKIDAKGLEENPSIWGEYRLDKNFNHGALICKIDSSPYEIFTVGKTIINSNGNIYCRINDTAIDNNVGSISLNLKVKKKSSSMTGDFRVNKSFNHGALICRLNTKEDEIFKIGTTKIIGNGMIECRINDENIKNNIGSQSVILKIKSIN